MPLPDGHTLLTLFIVACGAGAFLRLVAKEKCRREKHLDLRLHEKMKELEEEECQRRLRQGRSGDEGGQDDDGGGADDEEEQAESDDSIPP